MGTRTHKGREILWAYDLPFPNFSCYPICFRLHRTMIVKSYTFVNMCTVFDKSHFADIVCNYPREDAHCHDSIGLPPTAQPDYPMMNLAAFWQQMLPIMPVLPILPTHKYCSVNNLGFDPYHGMEEVIGLIAIRSLARLLGYQLKATRS